MDILLLVCVIALSLYFIIKYGFCGLAGFFFLSGSFTDSAGILYAVERYILPYKLIIWAITYVVLAFSIFKVANKATNKVFLRWYFAPYIGAMVLIVTSTILQGGKAEYWSTSLIMTGIPYFFMWVIGRRKKGREKVLLQLVIVHAVVAILVILGKSQMMLLNGFTYVDRIDKNFSEYVNVQDFINNSISFFNFNKYEVQKTAQFHNGNALGFFSAVVICFGICILTNVYPIKKNKVFLGLFCLIVGGTLWFNSLTRGPIVLIFALYCYILTRPWKIRQNFGMYLLAMVIGTIPLIYVIPSLLEYLFPSTDNISYTSRLIGYQEAFYSISNFPLLGSRHGEYPAHIYTLKIMAYHGVPAGILVTIPFLHALYSSLKRFFNDIKRRHLGASTFALMLVLILYGVFFTNGTVSYVLFGILLGEVCVINGNGFYKSS